MTAVPPSDTARGPEPTEQSPAVAAAHALVADLAAQGVRDVVLAPGSRSAPLAYALAAAADAGMVRLHVRVDERSAGFLAVGLSRGASLSGDARTTADGAAPSPVAVVTTSGTAVANLHPAVLEAHHSALPLILLTADRPHELRGTRASQTTDQVGIFGSSVRAAADVPAPDGRDGEVRDLLATARRVVAAALGLRDRYPGPAHLNLAYRDPLHPTSTPGELSDSARGTPRAESDNSPGVEVVPPAPGPGADPSLPGNSARTLVIAGDGAGPDARRLAEARGWPLLAEPSSGATGGPCGVPAYRSVLGAPGLTADVEHVVVLGHPTLSRPVQRLLGRPDVTVTVVAPGSGPWPDAARNAARVVVALAAAWFDPAEPSDGGTFLARWRAAGAAAARIVAAATAAEAVRGHLSSDPQAPLAVARALLAACGPEDVLVVGASNPVRDLELVLGLDPAPGALGAPGPQILANRGLAGIDGTLSTASGIALAAARAGRRTRALVGDLTFLHDVGGLLRGPDESPVELDVVVVNDDGGSIFATLEHGTLAGTGPTAARTFERVFATPHGADIGALCAGYGVEHEVVADLDALQRSLSAPARGVRVLEVPVSRADRHTASRDLAERIQDAVLGALAAAHTPPGSD